MSLMTKPLSSEHAVERKTSMGRRGFTLIELLVVIAIMTVLIF